MNYFLKFNIETKLLIRIMLQDLKIFFTGVIDDCVKLCGQRHKSSA